MNIMKNKLQYLTVYLMIIMTTSLIYSEYTSLFFILNIIITILIMYKYRVFPGKKDLIFLWIISIILLLLYVYTNGSYTIMSMLNTITTIFFTITYFKFNKNDFINKYVNIVVFIAIISIIGYITDISNSFNFLIDKIPQLIKSNPGFGSPHGGIFYVFQNINHSTRNSGFCYEPGKYQYFLNLAIYFILFCKTTLKRINIKLLILILTLITTMSTTGIVMGLIIVASYILLGKNRVSKKFVLTCIIIAMVVIIIFFYEQTYEILYKKLQFNYDTKTFDYGSGKTRLNDIKLDIEIFLNNIFGNGWHKYEEYWRLKQYGNYLYTTGSSSNSLTSMFAVYGLVFSSYINYRYLKKFIFNSKNITIMILLIIMYFYQNLSQSFSLTPLMIIFIISNNNELFGKESR